MPRFNKANKASEKFDCLPDTLVEDPWNTINDFYEEMYPKAGRKVFSYASLQAISAFAPKLTIKGQEKRIAISILLLGNSGSGKTSMMSEVEDITPVSYFVSQDSEANMEYELANKGKNGVTVVVNDMKRMLGDKGRLKALEAMIGDGRISRKNTRNSAEGKDLDISLIGGAVPSDISKQIGGGLLFRVVPVMMRYEKKTDEAGNVIEDEAEEVGKSIVMDAGEEHSMDVTDQDIARYYQVLYKISNGELNDYKKPVGYHLTEEIKEDIFNRWNYLRQERGWDQKDLNWNRELLDGLRFACLSAYLNIPNRKKINIEESEDECVVEVNKEDAERAKTLMKGEMAIKWKYIQMNLIDDLKELSDLSMPEDIAKDVAGK